MWMEVDKSTKCPGLDYTLWLQHRCVNGLKLMVNVVKNHDDSEFTSEKKGQGQ
jgi:hypothetical protein